MNRREFLAWSAAALAARPSLSTLGAAEATPAHEALDETLEKLHATDAGLVRRPPWREFLVLWFDRLAPGAVSIEP